ncbi:MAG: ATP-binding protein, partial [Infirmifilum sp.]
MLNPWCEGRRSSVVEEWRSRKVRWRPPWIDEISLKPFSLNIVVGPRLVGKTTGLHLLMEEELFR